MATLTETWEPANHLEEQLRDALRAGDQDAYFAALSGSELFVPLPQPEPGAPQPAFTWPTATRDGRTHVLAYTSREAARACLGPGYDQLVRMPLMEIARNWPNIEWWLAVDSGLPIEGYLPAWFIGKLTAEAGNHAATPNDGSVPSRDGGFPQGDGFPQHDQRQAGSPAAHQGDPRAFGDGAPPVHGQAPAQDGPAFPGGPRHGDAQPGIRPRGDAGPFPAQGEPPAAPHHEPPHRPTPAPHGEGASFRPPAEGTPFPAHGDNASVPPGEPHAFPPRGEVPRDDPRSFAGGAGPYPPQGEPPAPHGEGASFRPPAEGTPFPAHGDNASVTPGELRASPPQGETGPYPPGGNTSVPPGEPRTFPPHGDGARGETRPFPPRGEPPYGDTASSFPGRAGAFPPDGSGSVPPGEPPAFPPQGDAPGRHADPASFPGGPAAPYDDRSANAQGEPPAFPVPGEGGPFPPQGQALPPGGAPASHGDAQSLPPGAIPPVPPQEGRAAPPGERPIPHGERPAPRRGRRHRTPPDESAGFTGEPPAFAPQGPTPPADAFPAPPGDAPAPFGEAAGPYGERRPAQHGEQPPFPGDAPPFPPRGETPPHGDAFGAPPGGVPPRPPQGEPPAPPVEGPSPYGERPAPPPGEAAPGVLDGVPYEAGPPSPAGLNGAVPPAPADGVPNVAETRPQRAVSEFEAMPPAPAPHDVVPPPAEPGVPMPPPMPYDGPPAGDAPPRGEDRPAVPPAVPGDAVEPAGTLAADAGGPSGVGVPGQASAPERETPSAAGAVPGEGTPPAGPVVPPASAPGTDALVTLHFTPDTDFTPLDDEERELFEAARHGDGARFLRILAEAQQIWVPMVEGADLMLGPGRPGFRWYTREENGRTVVPLFTGPSRMREAMGGHPFVLSDPAKVLRFWPDASWDLVVNAGSPIGATIPGERMTELSRRVDAETAALLARDFPAQNDAERHLFDARADADLMVKVLLETSVFLPVWQRTPPTAQISPADPAFPWSAVPVYGHMAVPVFTSFDWMKEAVGTTAFVMPAFADLLAAWPEPGWAVSVNPGTPIEVTLTGEQIRAIGGSIADRTAGTLASPATVIAPPADPRSVEDVRIGPDGMPDAAAPAADAPAEAPAQPGEPPEAAASPAEPVAAVEPVAPAEPDLAAEPGPADATAPAAPAESGEAIAPGESAAPREPGEADEAVASVPEQGTGEAGEGTARIWTIMQKVVPHEQVPWYRDKAYDRVAGFVHRVRDVIGLGTPKQLYEALGLLRHGSPFHPDDAEVHVIRWPAYLPELYRVPFGGTGEDALTTWGDDGWVVEAPPFQGDGFAPGSGGSIPEYKVDSLRLPHGAEMYVISGDGTERFVARYDADRLAWGETK